MDSHEHMKKKGKVIKKKVVIQKIGYGGHGGHRGHRGHHSYWRRPAYFRPPPIITQPVYTVVERPSDSMDDSSIVKSVLGIGLIISMITLIIVGLKR
mgnify:FL=1